MEPKFSHAGCPDCKFIGQDEGHDYYFCDHAGHLTVIARYGDNPEDYMSGLIFARLYEKHPERSGPMRPLLTALQLAQALRLCD